MISTLELVDLLGRQPNLMIRGKKSYRSTLGGIFTIFLILMSALAFVAFGRDIFEKNVPEVTFSKNPSRDVKFDFTGNSTFIMTIYDPSKNVPINDLDKLFRIFVTTQDVDPSRTAEGKSVIEEYYELVKCPIQKLTKEINETLFLPFDNYYCFPEPKSFELRGTWVSGKNKVFKLDVGYCKNTTENNNSCYSKETIAKILPSTFNMHYIIFDAYPDHSDYLNPIKSTIFSGVIRSNINIMTRLVFWLKNVDYITDEGWILESLKYESYTAFDRIEPQIYPTPNTSTFFSHFFSLAPMKEVYSRKYIKIQGVSAYIGGFITFFKAFLQIISLYLTKPFFMYSFYEIFSSNPIGSISQNESIYKTLKTKNKITNITNFSEVNRINITEKKFTKNGINNNNFPKNNSEIAQISMPEKISNLKVLFRCFNLSNSDEFSNSLLLIEKLFRDTISVENLCNLVQKLNILEDHILKNEKNINLTSHAYKTAKSEENNANLVSAENKFAISKLQIISNKNNIQMN